MTDEQQQLEKDFNEWAINSTHIGHPHLETAYWADSRRREMDGKTIEGLKKALIDARDVIRREAVRHGNLGMSNLAKALTPPLQAIDAALSLLESPPASLSNASKGSNQGCLDPKGESKSKITTVADDQIADVLRAMVLAKFEVRLTFNPLALDTPFACHTCKVAHTEREAPWSHGGHGSSLGQAIRRSWDAINEVPE
jgi:hypothetical protein